MTSFDCRRMQERMVAALGGHATEAERLELEAHLDACDRCRAEHDAWTPIRRLKDFDTSPLTASARERVRRAVLSAAAVGMAAPVARPTRRWLPALAIGVAAAAVLVGLLVRPAPSRVVAGDVEVVGAHRRTIVDEDRLRATAGGEVRLDGPMVQLEAATEAVWRAPRRTLRLERGRVHVEVDPRARRSFAVETARFRVEVVGTVFDVDLAGVRTRRGHVRVLAPDGTLLADLHAGEAWSLPAVAATATATPAPAAAVTPTPPVAATPAAPASAPPVIAAAPPRRTAPARTAAAAHDDDADRLTRARAALLRGAGADARAVLQALAHPSHEQRAEARALLAESYLVERHYQQAIDGYQSVIDSFPNTPQAESALYARAQLELEIGRAGAAAATLRRYLDRYPKGPFADEARARLEMLRSSAE